MNTSHPYDLVIGLDRSDKKADLHLITTATGRRPVHLSHRAWLNVVWVLGQYGQNADGHRPAGDDAILLVGW